MIVRVSLNTPYQYINKEITLLQVIKDSSDSFVWVTDLDGKGEQINTLAVPFYNLPQDYLPDTDSYWNLIISRNCSRMLAPTRLRLTFPESDKSFFAALMSKMG